MIPRLHTVRDQSETCKIFKRDRIGARSIAHKIREKTLFFDLDDVKATEVMSGFHAKFIHSDRMTFAYWEIESGAILPEHAHENEQVCNVLDGEFELTINGQSQLLKAGMVGVIPSNAIHSGRAISKCRIMDVFQPVREDYMMQRPVD